MLTLILGATSAVAQSDDEPAVREAKQLFDQAKEQLTIGNAVVGRDLLRRSLALRSRIPTRYNLGIALRRTGETTEAIAMFEGLLLETSLADSQKVRIQEQLDAARGELATLSVTVSGAEAAGIELDGQPMGEARLDSPLVLRIDAGPHVVTARAGGTTSQKVDIGPGRTQSVDLHVLSMAERNKDEREKRRKRRATWITTSVAVATAVVLGAVLGTRSNRASQPIESPDGPTTETLLIRR